jgi:aspartyl-tRNA(Asn)/glutamyl-tRNA(Gln) amidotransferase subunit C
MPDPKINADQVRHVAKLARLAMSEGELQRLGGQLESILQYIAEIDKLDVANVPPMPHALPLHNVLREDVAGETLTLEQVLRNAPATDGAFFSVPRVLGAEEDSAG